LIEPAPIPWLNWMWMCSLSWIIANVVRALILQAGAMDAASTRPVQLLIAIVVQSVLLVSVLGVMQWIILREVIERAGRWIRATALWGSIGLLLGYFIAGLIAFPIADVLLAPDVNDVNGLDRTQISFILANLLFVIQSFIGGVAVGLPQSRLLSAAFSGTGRWIIFSGIGFAAAMIMWASVSWFLSVSTESLANPGTPQYALLAIGMAALSGLFGGLTYGAITAVAITRMSTRASTSSN
jgi:hypothetical protein